MSNSRGSRFHPPIVSGKQKFLRQKESEKKAKETQKKKSPPSPETFNIKNK